MGFVIASVAGFDPLEVDAVARAPYALTLWTYLQRTEDEHLRSLLRESETIRLADMIATGFHEPKKLSRFEQDWRKRALEHAPSKAPETRDDVEKWANELWIQHETARKRGGPVA